VLIIVPAPVVSVLIIEPVLAEVVSAVTVVESVVEDELPLPHAAKAPNTNTNNNFFIFLCLLFVCNCSLIQIRKKGNPQIKKFFEPLLQYSLCSSPPLSLSMF
jgi:hypothetical protein